MQPILHRQTRVCTVVILLSLESEFNLANWSGYFSHGSISFLKCFTTSNAAVGLFGKYS